MMNNFNADEVINSMKSLIDLYEENHEAFYIPMYFESFARCHNMKLIRLDEPLNEEPIFEKEALESLYAVVCDYSLDEDSALDYWKEFQLGYEPTGGVITISDFIQLVYNTIFDLVPESKFEDEFLDYMKQTEFNFKINCEFKGEENDVSPILWDAIKNSDDATFINFKF